MHELSIALSIVDIAEQQVESHRATRVEKIELEIGTLAGIELDALTFCWPLAVKDTVLEQAERVIHEVTAVALCPECQHEYAAGGLYAPCPNCDNPITTLLQGQELRVQSLTLYTEAETVPYSPS